MRIQEIVKRCSQVQETDIPELEAPDAQQQEPGTLRRGLNILGNVLTAKKKLSDPRAFADEELKNLIDPNRQNLSLIRRIFNGEDK